MLLWKSILSFRQFNLFDEKQAMMNVFSLNARNKPACGLSAVVQVFLIPFDLRMIYFQCNTAVICQKYRLRKRANYKRIKMKS